MWIAGPISKEKEYKWGRCKTVNKRSDVIKIGDRPLVGHDAQSWAFVAVCGAKKLHILERPWCKDIKHRCSLMKLPWLFINPLQKKCKEGEIGGWSWLSICQDGGLQLRISFGRMLTPLL
jgi:hypothetical protein